MPLQNFGLTILVLLKQITENKKTRYQQNYRLRNESRDNTGLYEMGLQTT
jgi:hypothetical protein